MRASVSLVLAVLAAASCGPRPAAPRGTGGAPAAPAPPAPDHATRRPPPVAPAALGDEVRPLAYRLTLTVDPEAADYHGEIEIDLELERPTAVVWLHAAEPLEVTGATVTGAGAAGGGVAVDAVRVLAPSPDGILGVELPRPLPAGRATLALRFTGRYRDADALFAQEVRGRRYVYSDFEPVDARRAFPCFDEPRWKVPWTVTVRAPDAAAVYANSPLATRTRQGDGWTASRFAPTPPLPSYLVAVAVGPFDEVEVPGAPVPARILVPEGRGSAAAAAAELLGPLLRAAAQLVDRPVPFAKLDLLVVPTFGGAMENPGLITIASDFALAPADDDERQTLARILAHELAHLWFGDQVTLADWREVWLNEGAASWMGDAVVAAVLPAGGVELEALDDRAEAMLEDALAGVHPLRPDTITHPRQLFDAISYKKGAAVWRGLEAWLGPERFRAALGGYLDDHAWGSVTTATLGRALAAAAPELPVEAVLRATVERAGTPTVLVDITCKDGRNEARLRQGGPRQPTAVCLRWADPDGAAHRGCAVVDGVAALDLGGRCPVWLHPDAGAAGYYRWQLPRAWWPALGRAPLTPAELRDALDMLGPALAAGTLGLAEARPVLTAAVRAAQRSLTVPALDLARLALRVAGPAEARALAAELRLATHDVLGTIGWSARRAEPPGRRAVRSAVLRAAGELTDDRQVVTWARKLVRAWQRGAALPDDVAEAALIVTAAHAGPTLRAALLAAARRPDVYSDAVALGLGRALAAAPDDTGLAALRARATAPLDRRAELGLVAELLADPRRADAAMAALGAAALFYPPILKLGPWCAPPARRGDAPPVLVHTDAVAAWRAERCRALAARLTPGGGAAAGPRAQR